MTALLIAEEYKRRQRKLYKALYKATKSDKDRTIGMSVKYIPGGKEILTKREQKAKDQAASVKYRNVLKKSAKDHPMTKGELRQLCLDVTRRHV